MTHPYHCSNCGSPCDCDYLCPGCHGAVCDRCVHLGNEMKMLNRTFRCAKCKELATKRNEKEASMNKDGGAAFPVQQLCKNCGKPSGYHTWVTRKCPNGITHEEYDHDSAALLAEDAERERKDDNDKRAGERMGGYCPAGKCECVYFDVESYNSPVCRHGAIVIFVDQIRRCPLPASPIKPHPFQICARDAKTLERINEAKAAGRLSGLREAKEAVAKVLSWKSNTSGIEWDCHRDDAIAAIDRLMEGK